MLGEMTGEEEGRVTTRRVLPGSDPRCVRVEISFETSATILGKQGQNIGTIEIYERVPGQMYAEGQGIFMSGDGESAIWNTHGIGLDRGEGDIAFAASTTFQASEGLAKLNSVLVLIEAEAKADGTSRSTMYEWTA